MTEVNVPPDPEAEAMAAEHEMCAQLDASPIVPVEVAQEELDKPDGGMFKRTAEQEASYAKFKAALDQLMGDYLAKPLTLPRTAWDDTDEGQGIYTVYLDGREQWTVVTDDLAGRWTSSRATRTACGCAIATSAACAGPRRHTDGGSTQHHPSRTRRIWPGRRRALFEVRRAALFQFVFTELSDLKNCEEAVDRMQHAIADLAAVRDALEHADS